MGVCWIMDSGLNVLVYLLEGCVILCDGFMDIVWGLWKEVEICGLKEKVELYGLKIGNFMLYDF